MGVTGVNLRIGALPMGTDVKHEPLANTLTVSASSLLGGTRESELVDDTLAAIEAGWSRA